MNKYIKICSVLFFLPISLLAQNSIESILPQIEKNNSTLLALQKSVEANSFGNRTGIYLKNPEFEFNYLFGNPSAIGNRTDFSIRQSFDFPTAYCYKSKIANMKNQQLELEYQKQLKTVLLQARSLCIDIINANALKKEYDRRLKHAQSISDSYKARFNNGDVNVIEYNKTQLNLLNAQKESETNDLKLKGYTSELTSLNGGTAIAVEDTVFVVKEIPVDFEQWYIEAEKSSPVLSWLKQEIEISQKQQKLNMAMSLPKLSTGYMSEKVVGQQFQGLSVGISIPLWENKNTVKFAKANILAIQALETDYKINFYNKLKILHGKAISLRKTVDAYRLTLMSANNAELLKTAFDKGEISLIDYMMELAFYYSSINSMFETEKELQKVISELTIYQ
ncbi:MAG: TolC family protein [Bacteroidia bacterium]|nr:TolC family protein [Bacteroidia bacterium]